MPSEMDILLVPFRNYILVAPPLEKIYLLSPPLEKGDKGGFEKT
jgi:hypothetical protein